jgi:hypothetical protein
MTARLPMMNMPSVQKSILPAWSRDTDWEMNAKIYVWKCRDKGGVSSAEMARIRCA